MFHKSKPVEKELCVIKNGKTETAVANDLGIKIESLDAAIAELADADYQANAELIMALLHLRNICVELKLYPSFNDTIKVMSDILDQVVDLLKMKGHLYLVCDSLNDTIEDRNHAGAISSYDAFIACTPLTLFAEVASGKKLGGTASKMAKLTEINFDAGAALNEVKNALKKCRN